MTRQTLARALLLASIAMAALPATAMAQSPFATEMSAGREAFDGSNYGLAERHFQGALDVAGSDGQKSTALYSLAVSAQRQGRMDEAKERAQRAVELAPKNTQAQRLLEELTLQAQRPQVPQTKSTKQAAAPAPPAAMTAPLSTTLVDQIPQRKAAPVAAKEATPKEAAPKDAAPKEQIAATPKEAPAPKAKASAAVKIAPPSLVAAAATSKLDPTSIGTLEPSGARLLWTLPAEKRSILGAGFAAGDQHVVVVSGPLAEAAAGEIELKRYDLATGKPGDGYSLHSDQKTAIVAVPPSGAILATAVAAERSAKKAATKAAPVSLHLWNGETVDNTEAIELEGSDRGIGIALDQLEFSRNGKRLVAAHRTGVEVFDTAGLKGVGVFRLASRRDAASARPAMAVSANGSRIVLTNGARIRVLEGSSNVRDIGPGGNSPAFDKIAISDNGSLIAASSAAGIRFYDTASGKESEALPQSPDVVAALAFSPGGEKLAVASGSIVQLWTMQGRKALVDLQNAGPVEKIAFSADGRIVLAAGEQGTRIWYIDPDTMAPKSEPVASNIVTSSVAKPVAAPPVELVNTEKPKPAETPKVAEPPAAVEARPAAVEAKPATSQPSDPAVARTMDPAVEKARRAADLSVERAGALERNDCDRVKALDAEIGSGALHGTCTGRVDQARREADRKQKEAQGTERTAALERRDCDRVKALDADIGSGALHGTCTARVDQARRDGERQQKDALVVERSAAIAALKCDEVKSLDAKIGDGDHAVKCSFESVARNGTARELYLAAARYDADRDRTSAKQLYRAIVDRFPQDDLAIRAAERMTLLSDMEAREKPAAADATVDPVRRDQRRQQRNTQR